MRRRSPSRKATSRPVSPLHQPWTATLLSDPAPATAIDATRDESKAPLFDTAFVTAEAVTEGTQNPNKTSYTRLAVHKSGRRFNSPPPLRRH